MLQFETLMKNVIEVKEMENQTLLQPQKWILYTIIIIIIKYKITDINTDIN